MIGENNPFNIRYSRRNNWLGQKEPVRGFCSFVHLDYGVRAAVLLVMRSYRKKGFLSVSEIISRYAPNSENDTQAYIDYVCHRLGVLPFFNMSKQSDYCELLSVMSEFEGNPVPSYVISAVIDKFNICLIKKL